MNESYDSTYGERIDPLPLGLRFALSHAPLLLLLSLPRIGIETAVQFLQFSVPLGPPQLFLLAVLSFGASCWLISGALLCAGRVAQGRQPRVLEIALIALRNLPKIFLSSFALFFAVLVGALILPLLVLVLFFIWAPLFCIAELLVPPEAQRRPQENDSDETHYEEADEESDVARLFIRKSLFDLGFARSLRLGSRFPGLTLQVFVLIWCANAVPYAVVDFFTDTTDFVPRLLRVLATSVAQALVAGAVSAIFMAMLPREGRRELELLPLNEPAAAGTSRRRRTMLFGIAAAMALACTVFTVQELQREYTMPETVVARMESVRTEQKSLIVTLRLEDPKDSFRWLEGGTFKLAIPDSEPESKKQPEPGPSAAEKVEEAADKSISARHLAFYDESGKELGFAAFPPYDKGPLKLILNFELDERLPPQGKFVLSYVSFFGEKTLVHEGEYGKQHE